jgi:phosphate transport system permease protein
MTIVDQMPAVDSVAAVPRPLSKRRTGSDRVFFRGVSMGGFTVLAIMVAVGLFLSIQSSQAFGRVGFSFLTNTEWRVEGGNFGVAAVVGFTVQIALIAVIVALPISMGTALFITEVAPVRLRAPMIALVDLMAAVPSVVYGLWGKFLLQGQIVPVSRWLNTWFGWIPLFKVNGADPSNPLTNSTVYTASTLICGVVVAMMVTPIQCVVMREVFSQVPVGEREGAFALGSTRWGMIRVVTLPFGRGGIIGGTMLGLGRALGETIAVVMIASPVFKSSFHVLQAGTNSVSMLIALRSIESSGLALSALFAAGLVLFAMTLVVNFTASWFVTRSRSGASSEA